jgi:hypothetical protein
LNAFISGDSSLSADAVNFKSRIGLLGVSVDGLFTLVRLIVGFLAVEREEVGIGKETSQTWIFVHQYVTRKSHDSHSRGAVEVHQKCTR